MEDKIDSLAVHPPGDLEWLRDGSGGESHVATHGGRFHVEWDPSAKVTAFGPLSHFIHFFEDQPLMGRMGRVMPAALFQQQRSL